MIKELLVMFASELARRLPELKILVEEPLSKYTYTKTGGPSDILAFPTNVEELQEALKMIANENIPLTILGNASNLIVRDGGIRGITLILTEMDQMYVDGTILKATAGSPLIEASRLAYQHSLTGLEFACGIPGSIGGAVYMNAGAYDGEVKDVIKESTVITRDGELKTLDNDALKFSYRHSVLQESDDICVDVTFDLELGDQTLIGDRMAELTHLRTSKQPLELPSCGSVFKRPPGYFTGKLIQDAGLQGKVWGGAQVSTKHAGFIVNINHATATDYIELIEYIQKVIKEKYGVDLEREVRIIGEPLE